MQGRQYRRMNSRSRTPGVSGSVHQMLWITGYLCITLGALLCTFVFPEVFHKLRFRAHSDATVPPIVLSKVNVGLAMTPTCISRDLVPEDLVQTWLVFRFIA
jgi:hypothetical protein